MGEKKINGICLDRLVNYFLDLLQIAETTRTKFHFIESLSLFYRHARSLYSLKMRRRKKKFRTLPFSKNGAIFAIICLNLTVMFKIFSSKGKFSTIFLKFHKKSSCFLIYLLLRVNEHSSDSYKGRNYFIFFFVFFLGKVVKFVSNFVTFKNRNSYCQNMP